MNIIYSCAAIALFASPAIAGIKIPRSVISYTKIDKATEKAKEEDKALAFVFTDKGTNWGPCVASSVLAFKALKKHSVIVYVNLNANDRYEYISPIILTGLRKAQKQSSSYPYAVISSVDQTKVFATLGGNVMASRKAYRNIASSIKEGLQGTFPHIPKKGTAIQWPVKGRPATYTYYFGSVLDKNTLGIHRTKGIKQVTPFTASNQTVGIQRYIKTLGASFKVKPDDAAEADDKPATTPVSHEPTQWTNLKGKNITATFVSLTDDKLTLTLKNGKSATIPLSTLSKASQEKANNYAKN